LAGEIVAFCQRALDDMRALSELACVLLALHPELERCESALYVRPKTTTVGANADDHDDDDHADDDDYDDGGDDDDGTVDGIDGNGNGEEEERASDEEIGADLNADANAAHHHEYTREVAAALATPDFTAGALGVSSLARLSWPLPSVR
jgi:hypothetical protein